MLARAILLSLTVVSAGALATLGTSLSATLTQRTQSDADNLRTTFSKTTFSQTELSFDRPRLTSKARAAVVSIVDAVADMASALPSGSWQKKLVHGFSPNTPWRDLPLAGIDIEGKFFKKSGEAYPAQIGVVQAADGALLHERMFRITPRNGEINYKAQQERLLAPQGSELRSTTELKSPPFVSIANDFAQMIDGFVPLAYGTKWDTIGLAQEWKAASLGKPPAALRDHVEWIDVHDMVWMLSNSDEGNSLSDAYARIVGERFVGAHMSTNDGRGGIQVLYGMGELPGFPETYGDIIRYQTAISQNLPELIKLSKQRLRAAARKAD